MALLAMDQYAHLLHDLTGGSRLVTTFSEAENCLDSGYLPILLPAGILSRVSQAHLPHSWEVTSDSLAAYLAARTGAGLLVLLKDVDGIYTADPRTTGEALLIKAVSRTSLANCGCVDMFFHLVFPECLTGWVINGRHPERLAQLLDTGAARGTLISYKFQDLL